MEVYPIDRRLVLDDTLHEGTNNTEYYVVCSEAHPTADSDAQGGMVMIVRNRP